MQFENSSEAVPNPSPPDSARAEGGLLRFLVVASLLPLLVTFLRLFVFWQTEPHTVVSGTLMSLAEDLSRGTFYRPLYNAGFYGGTRYFPLNFSLLAALLKIGMSPRIGGHVVAVAAMTALLAAVFRILRKMEVQTSLARSAALLALASGASQVALQEIRGDILPAALNLWGLTLALGGLDRRRNFAGAAVLFILAFSGKETTVFGVLAVALWLIVRGQRWLALRFGATVLAGFAGVVAATDLLSRGRFLTILRACAAADASIGGVLLGPLRVLIRSGHWDPIWVPFMCLGLAAAVAWPWRPFLRDEPSAFGNSPALVVIYFVTTATVTCVILGSPGTDFNHLLDLHVAAILVFTVWISRQDAPGRRFGIAALACSAIYASALLVSDIRGFRPQKLDSGLSPAVELARQTGGPVLAHNPWVAILAGKPVYVQDPFSFRLVRERAPGFAEPLFNQLRRQEFAAVVLDADPLQDPGPIWYATVEFGPGFLEALTQRYRYAGKLGNQFLFLPDDSRSENRK